MAVEPVIRDLRTTWWGFDTKERVLFPGDGFAYSHYHEDGHCGLVAEEAISLDLPDVSSTFADLALFWTKFADMNVYCDRLDELIERLGVKVIGADPRPADHRREGDGAEGAAGAEGSRADAGVGHQREGRADRAGGGVNPLIAPLKCKAKPVISFLGRSKRSVLVIWCTRLFFGQRGVNSLTANTRL